jgi:lipopolysaccharide heptosyltransferase I
MSLTGIEPRRIGLVKPSALGDIVHALPVLGALRQRFPAASITWVVNRAYATLLQGHPHLDNVLAFDRTAARGGWLEGLRAFADILRAVRSARFDLVIDLQGLLRTGIMTLASGARWRLGLSSAREGARFCYNHVLTPRDGRPELSMHAVDRYWLAAQALGVGDEPKCFSLPIPADASAWATQRLRDLPRPWLMTNVGTRWETKRWPTSSFAELATRAHQHFGASLILVGGPEESPLARQVCAGFAGPACDLTGQTTLPQLVAVLEKADVVVSNDSGPLHLAVALGRPVVAPFTCTSPQRTGPYGQPGSAVLTGVDCAASFLKRCSRLDCMKELTADRLWPILRAHLRQGTSACA